MFKRIETDEVLLVENGVYKPSEAYEGPEGGLYVKSKGGYVRVKAKGDTSHPSVSVSRLLREGPLWADSFGRLCVEAGDKRKPVQLQFNQGDGVALLTAPSSTSKNGD